MSIIFIFVFGFADVFPLPFKAYPKISFEAFNHKKPFLITFNRIKCRKM